MAIRGISDAADEELDFSLEEFCDRELRISPLRVLACIARKPRIIPQLMRLAAHSKKAGLRLAAGVELALKALAALN
jgi:adenosylhomocysteine nucleosidase